MTKPELLMTAGTLEEMERYFKAGADAVNIGEQKYGMRLPGDITIEQMEKAVEISRSYQGKIYVIVNNIFDNKMIPELEQYISKLKEIGVDAIEFGDPAVLMSAKTVEWDKGLIWNAEMTSTNYATAKYWASKGASRVVLARELNLQEVLDIKRNVDMEVQVQVHGMTNIYHSGRPLVQNFHEHQGTTASNLDSLGQQKGMYLVERERKDLKFPIFEDQNGTHVMSSDDICMLEDLHELMQGHVNSFKIEGLLKSVEYNEIVLKAYRKAIDVFANDPTGYEFDPDWLESIEQIQPEDRELSFGFFYKEQVY